MAAPHPLKRRFHAEDLVRLRAADERRRYVASQRSARIDANPHQIDAVLFALDRIPDGGCILADEVGLGKTIEAGLVVAQLLAEGAERVLVIAPKSLLGQWRQELFDLFHINASEWRDGGDLARPGVYLVTRDFAGSDRGSALLEDSGRFDLCVIDEAHEVFAGIYKRFDRDGNYRDDSPHAKMAGRVRPLLVDTPVLLLTATPIQNTLTELWGLAQYVEPTGTLLGDLRTFRDLFCAGDDRRLAEGQEHELRRRLAVICQRTLRRQAQDFMKQPFVGRRAQLFEYSMSAEERSLYDDVTTYLLQPGICAFRGNFRRLLIIGFHRRMASSVAALAASLERVAERLERQLRGIYEAGLLDDVAAGILEDLEDDDLDATDLDEADLPDPAVIRAELDRVRGFVSRARSLSSDSKGDALRRAVRLVLQRGRDGTGSGKVVIFTESLTTQDRIRALLTRDGLVPDGAVTLFRGVNKGPRVQEALDRWRSEVLAELPAHVRPTPAVAVRLALVHEFRTRSSVFISTEAGAKGLNLQFADTLINYDLPWNPQRIEQRIGRIHRYGQTQDVTVINFVARDNEAQRLTFEILSQKLDLFGTVLDASDVVLHEPATDTPEPIAGALAVDFETRLRRIYERARSQDEIQAELERLRETMQERREHFEDVHRRTAGLIERRFDAQVKQVFRRIRDELPRELAALDRDLERVVTGYLAALDAPMTRATRDGSVLLQVGACERLPEPLREGVTVAVGDPGNADGVEALHLGHPLVAAAVEEARRATAERCQVRLPAPADLPPGTRGRLRLLRVRHHGFEQTEELLPVAVLDGQRDPVPLDLARSILRGEPTSADLSPVAVRDIDLDDAVDEVLFFAQGRLADRRHERFHRAVAQVETSLDDRLLARVRQQSALAARIASAEHGRDIAIGAEARAKAQRKLERLAGQLADVEDDIRSLRRREDPQYTRWMSSLHQRHARTPDCELLFDVEFELT